MILKIADYLRNLHREEEGFTLIELLIVIAIIAVIAAIAIPMVASRIDDARESADKANVRTLQGLVDQYYIDEGEFPTAATFITVLKDEGYLHEEVESPYPNVTDGGYKMEIIDLGSNRSEGKVTSTQMGKWKNAEPGGD